MNVQERRFGNVMVALAVCLLSAACQSPQLTLMPTPEILRDARFNVFRNDQIESNELETFYVTSRTPARPGSTIFFESKPDRALHFGYATARIGAADQDFLELISQSTTKERDQNLVWSVVDAPVLGSVDSPTAAGIPSELAPALVPFFKRLNAAIDATVTKALIVYAHGADNEFNWSVSQGAQYQYFTGDNEVMLTFSWPSPGSALGYGRDKRRANAAAEDFAYLLELLGRHCSAERINVIAFSAGGRVAGGALGLLGSRGATASDLRLNQVYLTQSDQPLKDFLNDLPGFYPLMNGLTITTDPDDPVLGLARLTDTKRRLGAPMKDATAGDLGLTDEEADHLREMVNSNSMTVINLEPTQIQGFKFSHGAWYENPWISTDTLVLMLLGLAPEERGLDSYTTGLGLKIWFFPDDYLDRLKAHLSAREAR